MFLKNYFVPEVLETFKSNFNSEVELVKFGGQLRLDMGGLTQSGWIIEQIWGKALRSLLPARYQPKKVLILGFGAGSSAKLIARRYKSAEITAVEIDPVVIDIGKKYFKTLEIPNLKIVTADAVKFAESTKQHFDITMVDCYLGDQVPKELSSLSFLKRLTSISTYVVVNRLFWADYQKKTVEWLDKIEDSFNYKTCRTPSNLVILIKELPALPML